MQRLALLILLLTVVYSWEELKYAVVRALHKYRKSKFETNNNFAVDSLVGDLVLLGTLPLNLSYLIIGSDQLSKKLIIILGEVVIILLVTKLRAWYYHPVFNLVNLVSPIARFGSRVSLLITPLLAGLILLFATHHFGPEQLQTKLDILIKIAILGLILNATIAALEKSFRLYRLHLSALMRILLGILIVFMIH